MEPALHYARTSDGVDIACWSLGEGPALVQMPTIPWSHCSLEWEHPGFRAWYERLLRSFRVIRFDTRGTGLSDRARLDHSLETYQLDLEAVVDKFGLERFALTGGPQGGAPSLAFAAAHPDRIMHLLPWCTFARYQDWQNPQLLALQAVARVDWTLYTETLAHALAAGWAQPEAASQTARLMREAADLPAFEAMLAAFADIDVEPLLPRVEVPTTIIHRRGLLVPPASAAQRLATQIRGASLLLLEGDSVLPFVGDMESVAAAFERAILAAV